MRVWMGCEANAACRTFEATHSVPAPSTPSPPLRTSRSSQNATERCRLAVARSCIDFCLSSLLHTSASSSQLRNVLLCGAGMDVDLRPATSQTANPSMRRREGSRLSLCTGDGERSWSGACRRCHVVHLIECNQAADLCSLGVLPRAWRSAFASLLPTKRFARATMPTHRVSARVLVLALTAIVSALFLCILVTVLDGGPSSDWTRTAHEPSTFTRRLACFRDVLSPRPASDLRSAALGGFRSAVFPEPGEASPPALFGASICQLCHCPRGRNELTSNFIDRPQLSPELSAGGPVKRADEVGRIIRSIQLSTYCAQSFSPKLR